MEGPPQEVSEQEPIFLDEMAERDAATDDRVVRITGPIVGHRGEYSPVGSPPQDTTQRRSPSAASSRATDAQVDTLALKLEDHCRALKQDVLEFFARAKGAVREQQEEAMEAERRAARLTLQAKQEEADLLKEELGASQQRAAQLSTIAMRLARQASWQNERALGHGMVVKAFIVWKQYVVAEKRTRRRQEKALRWYDTEHMKRRIVRTWRAWTIDQFRTSHLERVSRALGRQQAELQALHGAEVSALQAELQAAQQQLRREEAARNALEEEMKRAFMRGVCALNLEAMTIMKRGTPPGGANPFPIDLPPAASSAPSGSGGPAPAPATPGPAQADQPPPPPPAPGPGPSAGGTAAPAPDAVSRMLQHLQQSLSAQPPARPPPGSSAARPSAPAEPSAADGRAQPQSATLASTVAALYEQQRAGPLPGTGLKGRLCRRPKSDPCLLVSSPAASSAPRSH